MKRHRAQRDGGGPAGWWCIWVHHERGLVWGDVVLLVHVQWSAARAGWPARLFARFFTRRHGPAKTICIFDRRFVQSVIRWLSAEGRRRYISRPVRRRYGLQSSVFARPGRAWWSVPYMNDLSAIFVLMPAGVDVVAGGRRLRARWCSGCSCACLWMLWCWGTGSSWWPAYIFYIFGGAGALVCFSVQALNANLLGHPSPMNRDTLWVLCAYHYLDSAGILLFYLQNMGRYAMAGYRAHEVIACLWTYSASVLSLNDVHRLWIWTVNLLGGGRRLVHGRGSDKKKKGGRAAGVSVPIALWRRPGPLQVKQERTKSNSESDPYCEGGGGRPTSALAGSFFWRSFLSLYQDYWKHVLLFLLSPGVYRTGCSSSIRWSSILCLCFQTREGRSRSKNPNRMPNDFSSDAAEEGLSASNLQHGNSAWCDGPGMPEQWSAQQHGMRNQGRTWPRWPMVFFIFCVFIVVAGLSCLCSCPNICSIWGSYRPFRSTGKKGDFTLFWGGGRKLKSASLSIIDRQEPGTGDGGGTCGRAGDARGTSREWCPAGTGRREEGPTNCWRRQQRAVVGVVCTTGPEMQHSAVIYAAGSWKRNCSAATMCSTALEARPGLISTAMHGKTRRRCGAGENWLFWSMALSARCAIAGIVTGGQWSCFAMADHCNDRSLVICLLHLYQAIPGPDTAKAGGGGGWPDTVNLPPLPSAYIVNIILMNIFPSLIFIFLFHFLLPFYIVKTVLYFYFCIWTYLLPVQTSQRRSILMALSIFVLNFYNISSL